MGKFFGTDGVRGVVGEDLTAGLAHRIGVAAGEVLADRRDNHGLVLIGRDTRISGDLLTNAISSGLMASGFNIVDLGVIPTPAVSYLVKKYEADFGVVISASHNPYEYNGIKFFSSTGFKLSDAVEEEIEHRILDDTWEPHLLTGESVGRLLSGYDGYNDYKTYLKSLVDYNLEDLVVAVDAGNGALSVLAKEVLSELGAEVHAINTEPNGCNINDQCGSTAPEKIQALVKDVGADIGLSFDGDADRIIAVDELGRIVDGDHILAICGTYLKEKGKLKGNMVVGTVMTNIGLDRYLKTQGIKVIKTKVGDRYVLETMVKNNYVIGGEQSGHIIFTDFNTTGDGLATGLHIIEVMLEKDKKLSELNDLMVSYPQVLVNAHVNKDRKMDYLNNPTIKEAIIEVENTFGESGRVVIRPSGTEPLVRVMIEGDDQEKLELEAKKLAKLIEQELN